MAELNEQQLVLLNTLVYLDANYSSGTSVGAIVNDLLQEGALDNMDFGGGMTKTDVEEMLQAINSDDALKSLVVDSCVDTDIRGVCFVDADNQATIAFRGTGPAYAAWDDNCQGGYLADTDMQKEALEFAQNCARRYDDITVTGHSKGGNMAQYVTVLMGNEVDRCVSFDGQGFGDEFFIKYADEIAANKDKIRSVCAYNDYVNILLTPIAGEIVYLKNGSEDTMGGHYIYELYKHPDNKLDKNGEYIQNTEQHWIVKGLNWLVDGLSAYCDLWGYDNALTEFLIYSLVGSVLGMIFNGEEDLDWGKILKEFIANIEDYIEAGYNGQGGAKADYHNITANTDAMRNYSRNMTTAAGEIEELRGDIRKLQRAMSTNIIKGVAIGIPLQVVLTQLDSQVTKLEKLTAFLNHGAEQYDTAENAAKGAAQ